jgi:hypothetical protein
MRLTHLAGLALDARALVRSDDPRVRADAAQWIAANLLAIRGLRVGVDGVVPAGARVFDVRVASVTGLLAAVAAVPALIDAMTLPLRWRVALSALGMPVVEGSLAAVLSRGASVVGAGGAGAWLAVDAEASGYRVRIRGAERMLVA